MELKQSGSQPSGKARTTGSQALSALIRCSRQQSRPASRPRSSPSSPARAAPGTRMPSSSPTTSTSTKSCSGPRGRNCKGGAAGPSLPARQEVCMSKMFEGQVALVTGARQGIGLASATAFAEAGAAVVLADIDEKAANAAAQQLAQAGHQVRALRCDVAEEKDVARMVAETVAAFGRLDAAYNNAGIQSPATEMADASGAEYDRVQAVNLRGVWNCMKYELRQMRDQGSGAIVNCSSIGGLIGLPGRAMYHATKHGVIGLTKSAALEYAARGIRINAVCPGTIETPMVAAMLEKEPEAMKEIMRDQPIGRLGRPEEIAAAVLWLCSSGASFVIGHALAVDGGFTAH